MSDTFVKAAHARATDAMGPTLRVRPNTPPHQSIAGTPCSCSLCRDPFANGGLDMPPPSNWCPPSPPSAIYVRRPKLQVWEFPDPSSLDDDFISRSRTLIELRDTAAWYRGAQKPTWANVSVKLTMKSRVHLDGYQGRSTLLKVLAGELKPTEGERECHPKLRLAFLAQHAFHHIERHLDKTPSEYLRWRYEHGVDKEAIPGPPPLGPTVVQKLWNKLTASNITAHFEKFGLTAANAVDKPMATFEGIHMVRVVFAAATWTEPHLMFIDEPANFLHRDELITLFHALKRYAGGVVVICHTGVSSWGDFGLTETWLMEGTAGGDRVGTCTVTQAGAGVSFAMVLRRLVTQREIVVPAELGGRIMSMARCGWDGERPWVMA